MEDGHPRVLNQARMVVIDSVNFKSLHVCLSQVASSQTKVCNQTLPESLRYLTFLFLMTRLVSDLFWAYATSWPSSFRTSSSTLLLLDNSRGKDAPFCGSQNTNSNSTNLRRY